MFTKEAQTAWHKQLYHIFLVVYLLILPTKVHFFQQKEHFFLKKFCENDIFGYFCSDKTKN
jgi:hypothetical protein